MGRKVRAGDGKLLSKTARAGLKASGRPYYRLVERGVSLGYRKPKSGPGVWLVRRYVGNDSYSIRGLTTGEGRTVFADDHEDADGVTILDYWQAQGAVRAKRAQPDAAGPYTVARAADDYLDFLRSEGRSNAAVADAENRINAFIRPTLGRFEVAALKPEQLRRWRADLAEAAPRLRTRSDEQQKRRPGVADERARRATANRILTVLKAALNHAYDEERVASNKAWGRRVKPFENAEAARIRYLTIAEAKRLLNACDPAFRQIVQAALQTGARYGQIAELKISDFNTDAGTIDFRSRKGRGKEKAYSCVLTDEGVQFFRQVCAGRVGDDLMFRKDSGGTWRKSHQARPMAEACKRVGIEIGFHGLRHTWASLSVMNDTPLLIVAKNLGHSDSRMIERHYGHLAPSYVADQIRAGAPRFGTAAHSSIVPLSRSK